MQIHLKKSLIFLIALLAGISVLCVTALAADADAAGQEPVSEEQTEEPEPYTGFQYENGVWQYYTVDEKSTLNSVVSGTVDGTEGMWYVLNGTVQLDYTGLCDYAGADGSWYYVTNGLVDPGRNSVEQNIYGWWYVAGGKVDFHYTGVSDFGNDYGWWYIKNGQVDFSRNSVEPNRYGWWYVTGGQVRFDYTGVADYANDYGWWYIRDGKVDFSRNSVEQNIYGWWYVLGGQVDFSYTGVSDYGNDYGWWYIKNGKVDFSRNSVEQNIYGWWYVLSGQVQFWYTGVADYANDYGWWYISGGGVDFSKKSVEQNRYGWWYVSAGQVDFSHSGVEMNDYGWWYIKKGQVDFSYNGTYKDSYVTCTIRNGQVTKSSSNIYEGYQVTAEYRAMMNADKGIWMPDRIFSTDEYYALVRQFMAEDVYATGYAYAMTGGDYVYGLDPGTRWDCSSMTTYFFSRYLCYYASKYDEAAAANPGASAAELQKIALAAVPPADTEAFYSEIAGGSLKYYLPEVKYDPILNKNGMVASVAGVTIEQAMYWGNPVYTADTYSRLSDTDPGSLQVGDLLFFGIEPRTYCSTYGSVTHVAIYLGEYYGKGNGFYMMENTTASSRRASGQSGSGRDDGVQISRFTAGKGSDNHILWHASRVINMKES